jgi:protein tyrosine/serine phosphatase
MLTRIWTWLDDRERRLRRSFGMDISTPSARRWAMLHYQLFDHAFLRAPWTNFWEIAPGVYRSNQPTRRRFEKYKRMGIHTVINLRGEDKFAHYLFEREICADLGLKLVNVKMQARKAPTVAMLTELIAAMRAAEKPFMIHCKSGADRTGIGAAVYLMVIEGRPVSEAKKQLSIKYIHLDFTATGVQDYVLAIFEERQKRGAIGFEDWLVSGYDRDRVQDGWDRRLPAADLA